MNKSVFHHMVLIFYLLLLFAFQTACTPSVPQAQYNDLQKELSTIKGQLTVSQAELINLENQANTLKNTVNNSNKALILMMPFIEVNNLLLENAESRKLKDANKITATELNEQITEQNKRFNEAVHNIDDPELLSALKLTSTTASTTKANESWATAYHILRLKIQSGTDNLTQLLKSE